MKQSVYVLIFAFLIGTANAADYRDIDPGDYFYINNWGENDHVRVVRKLGNEKVKVRDINTGEGMVVQASKLLTKSQLDTEETVNTIGGAAIGVTIIYCLSNPDKCE